MRMVITLKSPSDDHRDTVAITPRSKLKSLACPGGDLAADDQTADNVAS